MPIVAATFWKTVLKFHIVSAVVKMPMVMILVGSIWALALR